MGQYKTLNDGSGYSAYQSKMEGDQKRGAAIVDGDLYSLYFRNGRIVISKHETEITEGSTHLCQVDLRPKMRTSSCIPSLAFYRRRSI